MRRYALRLLPELAAQAAARQSGGSAARNAAFDVLRTRGGASHPWQRVPAWPHGLTAAATAPSAGGARSASSFAAAGAAARGAVQLRYVVGVAGALAASQWEELTASVKLSSLALLRLGRDVAAAAAIVAGAARRGVLWGRCGFNVTIQQLLANRQLALLLPGASGTRFNS